MHALILAGGFSTRLGALTQDTPKALLDVQGKPIVSQILDQILAQQRAGRVDQIALISNAHYHPVFERWLQSSTLAQSMQLLNDHATHNDDRLGAIGDIQLALELLGWREDLLVVSSDTLCSLDLPNFLDFFDQKQSVVNTVFAMESVDQIRGRLGNVLLDQEARMQQFIEKPGEPISKLTSIPYYIFPKDSLPLFKAYLDERNNPDSPGMIIQWLLSQRPVYGYLVEGYYHDVGTPESLAYVREHLQLG